MSFIVKSSSLVAPYCNGTVGLMQTGGITKCVSIKSIGRVFSLFNKNNE